MRMRRQYKHKYSLDSVSSTASSSNSLTTVRAESNSDIFYICNSQPVFEKPSEKTSSIGSCNGDTITGSDQYRKSLFRSKAQLNLTRVESVTNSMNSANHYMKHNNLDIQELSFGERVNLARIHYLTIPNGIRLVLILFCLGWFIFNAIIILKQYTQYSTVVFMEYIPPKFTGPPAISICTQRILDNPNNTVTSQINVIDVVTPTNDSEQFLSTEDDSLAQMNDINITCQYFKATIKENISKGGVPCNKVVPTVISVQEGRKCWTFFSDISGQMSRTNRTNNGKYELEYGLFPKIQLKISGKLLTDPPPNNEVDTQIDDPAKLGDFNSGLVIALHDPALLSFMQDIPTHRIKQGKKIELFFDKKIMLMKEPPFHTMCFSYSTFQSEEPVALSKNALFGHSLTTDSGLSIYRSRGECFLYCIWRVLNTGRCVNVYSIFTAKQVEPAEMNWQKLLISGTGSKINWDALNAMGRIRFCDRSNRSLSHYLYYKQQCLSQCNQACKAETFTINPIVTEGPNYNLNFDTPTDTIIDIQWSPDMYTYISHRAKMDLNEFLGALGGHAHIWLGLSVLHLVRYTIQLIKTGEFLPETSCCCMIYWWKSLLRLRKTNLY